MARGANSGTAATCAIGVMAKAPQSGRSKTRLCPPLTPDQAATLSAAFLRDTTGNIREAARSAPIAAYAAFAPPGAETMIAPHLAPGTELLLADGSRPVPGGVEGFGRCLLQALEAMLDRGHPAACVLSSDVPTLPTRLLVEAARILLAPGERGVLGACGRRRLLHPRPEAGPCPPVRRHRVEHRHRRRRDPGPGPGHRPRSRRA